MGNLYALIMAGGGGTRLWPHSRLARPKQFVNLFGERSLFQITCDRIAPLIPPENIFVVTGARYIDLARAQQPALPPENFITEPAVRNTAPAVGLGTLHIRRRDPNATVAVLSADHLIRKEQHFRACIAAAAQIAASGTVVTLGIHPDGPNTGFGYIEQGEPLGVFGGFEAFRVARFTEKPDAETAQRFIASGRYHWNSGMFIWTVKTVMAELERQQPALHAALCEIDAAMGKPDARAVLERVWAGLEAISVDYAVMEGARDVAVLPVDIGWRDVGSWAAVYDELAQAADANVTATAGKGVLLAVDTEGCLVQSDRLVATVGLRDLVIVDTGDALLICPRDRTQEVKTLVTLLQESARDAYL